MSYSPPAPGSGPAPLSPSDETMWSALAHASGLVLAIIGPLLIMVIMGERSPRVKATSTEALNFQITYMIAFLVSIPLFFVVIGIVTLTIAIIAFYVLAIIATVNASRGVDYRYPGIIRLVH